MLAGILERETRSGNEVLHRLGNPDLRRACRGGDSRSDRNGDPRALAVDDLAFTGMHSRTDLDPQLLDPFGDVERTPDSASCESGLLLGRADDIGEQDGGEDRIELRQWRFNTHELPDLIYHRR